MLAGMALATLFVTLPFVVRELIPVLEQMDPAEEEAARTLGATDWEVFWHVTLPNIKLGLLYGVILTNAVSTNALTLQAAGTRMHTGNKRDTCCVEICWLSGLAYTRHLLAPRKSDASPLVEPNPCDQ